MCVQEKTNANGRERAPKPQPKSTIIEPATTQIKIKS